MYTFIISHSVSQSAISVALLNKNTNDLCVVYTKKFTNMVLCRLGIVSQLFSCPTAGHSTSGLAL